MSLSEFTSTVPLDMGQPMPVPTTAELHDYLSLICGIIAGAIIIILMTIFITYSLKIECCQSKSCKQKKIQNKKTNKKPLRLAIAIFIGYFLLSVTSIAQTILFFKESKNAFILFVTGTVLNSLTISLVYSFMILRLYDTFEGTIFEITKLFLISHLIVTVYIAIGCCLFPVVLLHRNIKSIGKLCYIIIVLLPFTIGLTHLIYSFNSKLFSLVLLQRKTLIHSNDNNNLNERQLKLLRTIRKHSILGAFMVLSVFIILLYGIFIYHSTNIGPDTNVILYWIVNNISIILTSTCLFIGFTQHNKMYMCLCKHCDNQCTNICIKVAINQLQMNGKNSKKTFSVVMTENRNSESKSGDMTHHTQ